MRSPFCVLLLQVIKPGSRMMMMRLALMGSLFFFLLGLGGTTAVATGDREDNNNPVVELSSRDELVNIAGYGEDKLSTVTISGKLLCHACMGGMFPVPTHPVSGASVAVFCGIKGKSKRSWARATTDEFGGFYIDLPSHLHAIPNLEKVCLVKVLHLPKTSLCRPAFKGKHQHLKLMSIAEGARLYTTHDILLMPKPLQGLKSPQANN